MGFQIGDTVGDYQIISFLGAGGMGKVYKVKNLISDRIDAMKVLLPDLANDPELADRFIREIKVLAKLNHPNIAGLRTAFNLDNQLLMIMEFVEGVTLEDKAKSPPSRWRMPSTTFPRYSLHLVMPINRGSFIAISNPRT